jgi:hypothetical protein
MMDLSRSVYLTCYTFFFFSGAVDLCIVVIMVQLKEWNKQGRPHKLCTKRLAKESVTSRATIAYKKDCHQIEVDLDGIVSLDKESMTVLVEPRVNMGSLAEFLLPQGYTIPVVPELKQLTVGGLLMGKFGKQEACQSVSVETFYSSPQRVSGAFV